MPPARTTQNFPIRATRALIPTARVATRIWEISSLTLSIVLLLMAVHGLGFQGDFNGDLYLAGLRILHGVSPYQPATLHHEAAIIGSGGTLHAIAFPRWPMPILVAATPLSLLPMQVADWLFALICVGSIIGALRLLDVRDGRCLLVALVSAPAVLGVGVGNISPLLLLGAAAAWRFRGGAVASAATVTGLVVSKVLFWPLGVWLLMLRRRLSVVLATVAVAVLVTLAWATIGFDDLVKYPGMLLDIMRIGEARGASLTGFLMFCGVPFIFARAVAVGLGVLLLHLAWRLARHPEYARNAYGLVIVAILAMTPVVWSHYLLLLFVPIALMSPKLSPIWYLPTWVALAPTDAVHSYGLRTLPILCAQLVLVGQLSMPLIREFRALHPLRQWRRTMVATARATAPS